MIVFNTIQNDARVIRAAEALYNGNHEVTVISCDSDKNYHNDSFTSLVYESGVLGPKALIKFWLFCIKYILQNSKNYDIIYYHDYYMPIIGRICNLFLKKPWVYDAHELLIQRKSHKWALREKIFFWLERISIKKAHLVIAANDERLMVINKFYKLKKSISVANIADLKILSNETKKKDYIVYQGVLNEERKVSNYVKVLTYLPKNIKLKLIGGGNIEYYKNLAKELKVEDRTIFTGRIPYSELLSESLECKIGFVSYKMDDLNNYYCSPNKLFEYIQLGLSVIVSPQPFLRSVINDFHVGEIWDEREQSISDLAEYILRIFNNSAEYQKGQQSFLIKYSNSQEMKKLTNAINQLQ